MESPMSRTRGRLLSFACEIQMSHHSMASRAGGAASGLASATLLANPAAKQSAVIKLTLIFITAIAFGYGGFEFSFGVDPAWMSFVASSSETRAMTQATHDSPRSSAPFSCENAGA